MLKLFFTLYFTCYACYIFYTREPDYFDGETINAIINIDTKTNKATATYTVANKTYTINASYPLRALHNQQNIELIYLPQQPEKAVVYSLWGYWFTWGELAMSFILLFAMYQLSVSITKNPTETAIKSQQEVDETAKRKYTDF